MLQGPELMSDDGLKRKRAVGPQQEAPAAKKPALDTPNKAISEETRSIVRGLFVHYQACLPGDGKSSTPAAFKAVVQAAQGDVAGRRLAARLIPRFISQFPDQVDVAAVALTGLHCRQSASDDAKVKHLEDLTRQDALNGLPAILQCAPCNNSVGERAVKHVLQYLFRLFPQAAAATDEPSEPEEEGEVTNGNGAVANVHFLKKLLRHALQLHPTFTLGYCFSCLAAASSNYSSNSASADPSLQHGVRLWLKDHLLQESTPSRETTPLGDGLSSAAAADGSNGTFKSAGKGCCFKAVLDKSQELQAWVMQQARGRATAPSEVRMVLETALQLLPPHAQLAAAKPKIDTPAAASRHHQQQRLASSGSLPSLRHQAQPANGMGFINGMEPPNRALSMPSSVDKQNSRSYPRASGTADGPHQQQQQQVRKQPAHTLRSPPGFPQPPGPICRVESCLLAFNLPRDISKHSVQAALSAEEVWIMEQQQQGASGGASACCTFKNVVDAAKAYLKHNGAVRFGPGTTPLLLLFADSLPACSSKRAAAAAEPSGFVWATTDAVGDAESITEDLRTAGLKLEHVHRVNNAAEPGTLLQTSSGQHAAGVVRYLLKKHPQPHHKAAAAADAADEQESLPPLPPEPPPSAAAGEWGPAGRQQPSLQPGQQQQGMPPLPPGPPPPWSQQQQQHLERVPSVGSLGRPASPAIPPGSLHQQQQQQQQQPGHVDAAGANLRHRSPGNTWGSSPSEWQQQQQQQTLLGSGREQHQSRWAPAASGQLPPGHHFHQQQQPIWHGRAGPVPSKIPVPAPPLGAPPLPPGQSALGLGASPGAAGSSSWHSVSPGHTPQHGPGLIPPPAVPPGQPPLQQNLGRGPPLHQLPHPQQQRQGLPLPAGGVTGPKPPLNPPWGPAAAAGPGYPLGGPPPGRVLWQGSIVKQSVRMCGVVCMVSSGTGPQSISGYAAEPQHWPEQLHVNYRICIPDAVEQYMQAAPEQRAVRLLLPQIPDADTQQLQQFINYLNGKDRAGMVKLPPIREQGLGPRSVYLIVPKPQVCQQLQVLWNERDVMLLAVVVPQHGSGSGPAVGGMSGHRQHRS